MQNINCCPSCDGNKQKRVIDILGKPVAVKNYICSADGVMYPEKPENIKLQLSVCPTSFCPGNCPFCIAKDTKVKRTLDINKFCRAMELLKAEDRIRGVKITGGEPFYDVGLLDEVVTVLFETFGLELELSVSTNGMWLDRIHEIKYLEYIEAIHISRHHYDDAINRELFGGTAVPSGARLKEIVGTVSYKDIFVFNCMLLDGYIDSGAEAHRFLDFSIDVGVPKVGFMVCTPINKYAADHRVLYEDVVKDEDESLLFTRGFYDYEFCRCRDGVYASQDGKLIEFYGRSTNKDVCQYCCGLVYDADNHLRDGFNGETLL